MNRLQITCIAVSPAAMLAPAQAQAQEVEAGGDETITIEGFISGTLFVDDQIFELGVGQNAIWADRDELEEDEWFHGGDVRNSRITLGFKGPKLFGDWETQATLEADFFGGFAGTGAFSDEAPLPRLRLAYVDLTNGRTKFRLGQAWSLTFGYVPESLSHIAFPLGWGAGGLIGWRFPGLFFFQDLTEDRPTRVQLQLGVFQGSWDDEPDPDVVSAGEATLIPQIEARLDISREAQSGTQWEAFVTGHFDRKDLTGPGDDVDDSLEGLAASGGFRVRPGPVTILAQGYVGEAVGQLFAQVLQFDDIDGWGAQGQLGYEFEPNWSLWAFYGIDDPDDQALVARQKNQIVAAMLRYELEQYAVGLEWYHAATDWQVALADETQVDGNQFALNVRYKF